VTKKAAAKQTPLQAQHAMALSTKCCGFVCRCTPRPLEPRNIFRREDVGRYVWQQCDHIQIDVHDRKMWWNCGDCKKEFQLSLPEVVDQHLWCPDCSGNADIA